MKLLYLLLFPFYLTIFQFAFCQIPDYHVQVLNETANFNVTPDAASSGANRFIITFAKPGVVIKGNRFSMSVYPNPVTNGIINLQMSN